MAVTLSKSQQEIEQMPLVELAYEILKSTKEPIYFRDIMKEVQGLRGMSEDDAMKVIARLYTELNIDGRFLCLGQNVWGLKRWYPVDKTQEKSLTSKRFVRKSGDAFDDEDDDIDEDLDEDIDTDYEALDSDADSGSDDDDDEDTDDLLEESDDDEGYDGDEEEDDDFSEEDDELSDEEDDVDLDDEEEDEEHN